MKQRKHCLVYYLRSDILWGFTQRRFGRLIADTEDNLQKAAYKLNHIITEYGLTISVQKTKSMAFKGRDPVRTKIVIDNKIIEQVNSFNCLGNMISYEKELDIDNNCITI